MSKIRIKLAVLGYLPYLINLKKVKAWESILFDVIDVSGSFSSTNNTDDEDWRFSDENIEQQLPNRGEEEILLLITNVAIQDNYFARRLSDNRVIISYHEMSDILRDANIPLHNLILRVLYSVSFVFKKYGGTIPHISELANFTHDETRGCIFDMNGIKTDIIYSLNRPELCSSCLESLIQIKGDRVSKTLIEKYKRNLKQLRKKATTL